MGHVGKSFLLQLSGCPSKANRAFNSEEPPPLQELKGRVWSKVIFCVWLAFAVKIVKGRVGQWSKIMFCVWLAFVMKIVKGRVWSKIMFCVWLAFAVKIVKGRVWSKLYFVYGLLLQ